MEPQKFNPHLRGPIHPPIGHDPSYLESLVVQKLDGLVNSFTSFKGVKLDSIFDPKTQRFYPPKSEKGKDAYQPSKSLGQGLKIVVGGQWRDKLAGVQQIHGVFASVMSEIQNSVDTLHKQVSLKELEQIKVRILKLEKAIDAAEDELKKLADEFKENPGSLTSESRPEEFRNSLQEFIKSSKAQVKAASEKISQVSYNRTTWLLLDIIHYVVNNYEGDPKNSSQPAIQAKEVIAAKKAQLEEKYQQLREGMEMTKSSVLHYTEILEELDTLIALVQKRNKDEIFPALSQRGQSIQGEVHKYEDKLKNVKAEIRALQEQLPAAEGAEVKQLKEEIEALKAERETLLPRLVELKPIKNKITDLERLNDKSKELAQARKELEEKTEPLERLSPEATKSIKKFKLG